MYLRNGSAQTIVRAATLRHIPTMSALAVCLFVRSCSWRGGWGGGGGGEGNSHHYFLKQSRVMKTTCSIVSGLLQEMLLNECRKLKRRRPL